MHIKSRDMSQGISLLLVFQAPRSVRLALQAAEWGQFGYRELLYYKGFPGMSTPVFTVSVCTIVKK